MPDVRYLIIGGGLTGDAACRGIRELDTDGSICLISAEPDPPYSRPPLSKSLWTGGDVESIWCGTADLGVDVRTGRKITALDLDAHEATDDAGESYAFERVLLATGGHPRRIPGWSDDVLYYRTFADFELLRERARNGANVVIVGGGFIGSEVAAALAQNGSTVTMVVPEDGISARVFPPELVKHVTAYYREKGVEVLTGASVAAIDGELGAFKVSIEGGETLDAAVVVAGLGIVPATDLAEAAGLQVDNGIVVDDQARAGRDDVFAAGDVARFPSAALGESTRVEHEDHAKSHGKLAGRNMAGAGESYDHLPFFYSDLFDLGYEAVGDLDARLETVADWDGDGFGKGIVYFLDEGRRPRGVLLWNVWDTVPAASELIAAGEPLDAKRLEF